MKANLLKIRNLFGVSEMEIKLGKFTIIEGKNGKGKTSILSSLGFLFDGGKHEAGVLKLGEKEGEAVLVLDDGQISKTVNETKSVFKYEDSEGRKLSAPVERLNALIDSYSSNPISFLTADKKTRAKVLLEALKPEVDRDELEFIAGSLPEGLESFELINAAYKQVYNERTVINRLKDDAEAAAKNYKSCFSDINAAEVEAEILKKRAELKELLSKQNEEAEKAAAPFNEQIKELDSLQLTRKARVADLEKQILDIMDSFKTTEHQIQGIKDKAHAARHASALEVAAKITLIESETRRLDDKKKTAEKEAGLRENFAREDKKVKDNADKSKALTIDLETIESIKARVLANLPIPGLEVKEGDIYLNGICYDFVNTAKRVEIALKIAEIRAGKLGLVRLDGIECLDSETFAEIEKQGEKTDLQFIMTRVTDSKDLKIITK